MSLRKVSLLDTTTRDGLQGLVTADQADRNGDSVKAAVDYSLASSNFGCGYMDAGFSLHKNGSQVRAIAEAHAQKPDMSILSFTRAIPKDIDHAIHCVETAARSGVAILVSPSNSHAVKFAKRYPKLSPAEIQDQKMKPKFLEACQHAAERRDNGDINDVFAYIEDSTRMTDPDQIKRCGEMCGELIDAGVEIISLPDTMGVADPEEYVDLFHAVQEFLGRDYTEKVLWSAHCHKDFGMGMANTMAAAKAGVVQILEGTFGGNGPGEGLGNCDLNVIVHQLLRDRLKPLPPYLQNLNLKPEQLYGLNVKAAKLLGRSIPDDSSIVGSGKPQRETGAGIHQDALKKALDALHFAKENFEIVVSGGISQEIEAARTKLDEAREGVGVYTHAEEFATYGVPPGNLFAVTDQTGHTGLQAAFEERKINTAEINIEKAHGNALRMARLQGHKLPDPQLEAIAWDARFENAQRAIQMDRKKIQKENLGTNADKRITIPLVFQGQEITLSGEGSGDVGAFVDALHNFMKKTFNVSVDVSSYNDIADVEQEIMDGENRDAEVLVNIKLKFENHNLPPAANEEEAAEREKNNKVVSFGFYRDQDGAAFNACLLAVNKWIEQNSPEPVE